jgi:drug/metabolite transporter (DMT)-like permease
VAAARPSVPAVAMAVAVVRPCVAVRLAGPDAGRYRVRVTGTRRDEWLGMAASAAAAVLFGTSYVATAFALRSFTPLAATSWRGLLASAGLAVLVWLGRLGPRAPRPTRGQLVRLAVLALAGGPVFIVAMNVAVEHAGATITSFVAGLYAVLAAVLAPVLLRERLTPAAMVGFVLALAGTLLLAQLRATGSTLLGIGVGLGAALSYALFLVLSRRWSVAWRLPGSLVTLSLVLVTGVPLGGWLLVTDPGALLPRDVRPESLVALAWLAIFPSVVAVLLVVAGVRRLDARRSSAFLLLNPVAATLLAWALLGERLGAGQWLGAGLVLGGMAAASGAATWLAGSGRRQGRVAR